MNFLTKMSTNSYNPIPDIVKVYDDVMAALRSDQPISDTWYTGDRTLAGITPESIVENRLFWSSPALSEKFVGLARAGMMIPYYKWNVTELGEYATVQSNAPTKASFLRLRLDQPDGDKKYHQPSGSPSFIYSPLTGRDLLGKFNYIVIVEGEKKAIVLRQHGIPAIAIGGIWNFREVGGGKLLSDLEALIKTYSITTVYFVGDVDTTLNLAFSKAAVAMSKALPPGVKLILPRCPFNLPKGIDDVAHHVGAASFQATWDQIMQRTVEVTSKTFADDLAYQLLIREKEYLPWLGDEGRHVHSKLIELSAGCGEVCQQYFGDLMKELFDTGKKEFRDQVKEARRRYRDKHQMGCEQADVPVIDLGMANKSFVEAVHKTIYERTFFSSGKIGQVCDEEFETMDTDALAVFIDDPDHATFIRHSENGNRIRANVGFDHAKKVIAGARLYPSNLRHLKRFSKIPVLMEAPSGAQVIEGYCPDRKILVLRKTGLSTPLVERMRQTTLSQAIHRLTYLLRDFYFISKGDFLRCFAALLTPAAVQGGLMGDTARAPYFHITKEIQGTGGGMLCQLIPHLYGQEPHSMTKFDAKELTYEMGLWLSGTDTIAYLDNVTGDAISRNSDLASFITEPKYNARVLFGQKHLDVTGKILMGNSNGATLGKDIVDRVVEIRIFKRPKGYEFTSWNGKRHEEAYRQYIKRHSISYLADIYTIWTHVLQRKDLAGETTGFRFGAWEDLLAQLIQLCFPGCVLMENMEDRRKVLRDAGHERLRKLFSTIIESDDVAVPLRPIRLAEIEAEDSGAFPSSLRGKSISLGIALKKQFPEVGTHVFDDRFHVSVLNLIDDSNNDYRTYAITSLPQFERKYDPMKSEIMDGLLEITKQAHGDPGDFELTYDRHNASDPFPFPAQELTIAEGERCKLVSF